MRPWLALSFGILFLILSTSDLLACACGCGVFDVQTNNLFPQGQGGVAYLEYDFMNQNQNRSGISSAPAANNPDKNIRTDFLTLGGQYMFNQDWGVMAEIPYWSRDFSTTNDAGEVVNLHHSAFGDVKIRGVYSGFSSDMSTGITFGLRLPTGDFSHEDSGQDWDRDSEIGTGSTDLLLGAYHLGKLTPDGRFSWFVNGQWDQPVLISAGYRPGAEFDTATGIYYDQWRFGGYRIVPLLQTIASLRLSDRGPASNPDDSGYKRLFLSPGVELDAPGGWHLYADVAFPVYQQMIGNQIVAQELFKLNLSYDF